MYIKDVLSNDKLSREGALRLVESLLEGEVQVDVNTGEVLICYGEAPQEMAKVEYVCGEDYTVDDFVESLNDDYCWMGKPYECLTSIADTLCIELPAK